MLLVVLVVDVLVGVVSSRDTQQHRFPLPSTHLPFFSQENS
jgi:hypothetical protein